MEKLQNFPFALIFVAYLGYLGVQFYDFNYASDGQVEMHKTQLANNGSELAALKVKLTEGQKFVKSLELKKTEIQGLVQKLSEYQGALSEGLDVPAMIKLLVGEAKKIELKVEKIEPGKKDPKEYYLEQEFRLDIKGTYQQIVLFIQRVSSLQRILRVEAFTLKPVVSISPNSKIINAQLSVRAYQYTMSAEDKIGKEGKPL